jgi:inhibitor of cysteine peptidase
MKLPIFVCLALVSAAALAGCTAKDNNDNMQQQTSEHLRTNTINKGELLTIALPSNHSTGYSWSVAEIDNDYLVLVQDPTYSNSADGMVGKSGEDIFQFQSIATGQTTLKLVYKRPFETGVAPAKTHETTVVIQ